MGMRPQGRSGPESTRKQLEKLARQLELFEDPAFVARFAELQLAVRGSADRLVAAGEGV